MRGGGGSTVKHESQLVLPIFGIMGFCGCNPMNQSKCKSGLAFAIVFINIIWMVLCILNMQTRQHVFGIGEDIFSMFALSQVLVKTIVLFVYRNVLMRISTILDEKFWQSKLLKYYKILSFIGKCYGLMILITIISIVFDPVVKGKRRHPTEFWNSNSHYLSASPFFEIIYVLQILTIYVPIMTSISTFDILYYFLIGFGVIQFEVLNKKLSTIKIIQRTTGDTSEMKQVIRTCVQHHSLMLNYLKDIDTVFNVAILSQFIGAVFFMCFTSYLHTLERNTNSLKFPIIAVAAVFQTMLYCFSGQLITNQGEKVGEVAYSLPWEDIRDKNIVTCLRIMIQVSQKEIRIKAGRMIDLSLRTFVILLRAAVSYYIFLKEVMKDG